MKYLYIGWCKEGTHDKIWGVIELEKFSIPTRTDPHWRMGKYLTFWGRRGNKLRTKLVEGTDSTVYNMFREKVKEGYNSIELTRLNEVYPEFESDLETTALWASLKL